MGRRCGNVASQKRKGEGEKGRVQIARASFKGTRRGVKRRVARAVDQQESPDEVKEEFR
jgi:hypothetical protein